MGRRGPPQQSAAVKIAKGTYQAHHHQETATAPQGRPVNPFAVDRIAHRAFEQIADELEKMGTLSTVDLSHLVGYAEAFELREQASALLQSEGIVLSDDKGKPIKHPAHTIWADACTKLRAIGNDLGTNANARSRIVTGDKAKPEEPKQARFVS